MADHLGSSLAQADPKRFLVSVREHFLEKVPDVR
jgi:hypothetical protein